MSPRRVFALSYSSATVTFARPLFRHIARRSSVIVEVALRDSVVARTGPSAEGVRDPKLQHSRRPILPSLPPPHSNILGLSAFKTVSLKRGAWERGRGRSKQTRIEVVWLHTAYVQSRYDNAIYDMQMKHTL